MHIINLLDLSQDVMGANIMIEFTKDFFKLMENFSRTT